MSKVTFNTISINKLFDWFDQRCLAVPEIQREFVWNASRACALLDSIYRGYPIGTAMIWRTGKENASLLRHGNLHVLPAYDPANNHEILFLIDGQQRLSVLHQVRRGEKIYNSYGSPIRFGDIYFSIDDDESSPFVYLRRPDHDSHFKVTTIISDRWRQAFRRLPAYKRKQVKACRQKLLGYRLFVIFMESNELPDVAETFIRINTQGMRVTEADRAFTTASRVKPLHRFRQLCARLPLGYDALDKEVYWTTLVLVRGIQDLGQKAFKRLSKDIDQTDEGERWFERHEPKVAESIKLACDYLVHRLGVWNYSLLPYPNMMAMLALFFYWNNRAQPNSKQREQIRRWFWHTAVLKRYAGSGFRRNILGDALLFKSLGRTRRGRYDVSERVPAEALDNEDYRAGSAISKAFKLLLSTQKPRFITVDEDIPLGPVAAAQNSRDLHHIWPRELLRRQGISPKRYNRLFNICYLVAHDNRSFGSQHPRRYLEEFRRQKHFARALRSHLIPHDRNSPLWDERVRRGFKDFVAQRRKILKRAFNQAAGFRLFES